MSPFFIKGQSDLISQKLHYGSGVQKDDADQNSQERSEGSPSCLNDFNLPDLDKLHSRVLKQLEDDL